MVNANPAKEWQNVLPKCNPFPSHIADNIYGAVGVWRCQTLLHCHRTLTSANALNGSKIDMSQQHRQQQQHHGHHSAVIKPFVWFAYSKLKRLAKMAAAPLLAIFANFANIFTVFSRREATDDEKLCGSFGKNHSLSPILPSWFLLST